MPAIVAGKQRDWIKQYVTQRTSWLKSRKPPVPTTTYRMTSFGVLIEAGNWNLTLPLQVHAITLSEAALVGDSQPTPGTTPRTLQLTTPYLRGTDVRALQQALASRGLPATADGVYGPFTDQLVKQWQQSQQPVLTEQGVGPQTRGSLGL
jgi:chitosanase